MTSWIIIALLVIVAVLMWWVFPTPLARLFLVIERVQGRLHSCRQHGWHYLEGGHGEPLVVLHGYNADAHHFCQPSRWLREHFRIIAPDIPGFGDTPLGQNDSLRIEDRATQILNWLDQMGIHEFYLGGNSMGGYLSIAMARQAPDRVRALWLLAPGGLHTATLSPVFEEVAEGRHNPLVVRNGADFRRLIDYCFVHPPFIPGPLRRFLTARGVRTKAQSMRIFEAMRHESKPLEELADGLKTPSLLIWGQSDQVLHPDGAPIVMHLLEDCECLMLTDIGHLPMIESAKTCAEAWVSFTESRAREEAIPKA